MNAEEELRAAFNLSATAPMPKLITSTVVFHWDDWKAFMVGLRQMFQAEIIVESNKQASFGDNPERYYVIENLTNPCKWGLEYSLIILINEEKGRRNAVLNRITPMIPRDLLFIYFSVYKPWRKLGPNRDQTRLQHTIIHGSYDPSDDARRKQFLAVKRVVNKMSTNRVRLMDEKTGRIVEDDWKGAPVRFGFAALEWQRAAPKRLLDYGGVAKEGWTFPKDHPWYQFDD